MNAQWHPELRSLSFNVKTLHFAGRWAEGGTPWQRDSAWEQASRLWWADAARIAREHGYEDVAAGGRSGGWLAPVPSVAPHTMADADYPKLEAFGEAIAKLLAEAPEYFENALREIMAEDTKADEIIGNREHTRDALLDAVREYVRAGHDLTIYRRIEAALLAYDEARA